MIKRALRVIIPPSAAIIIIDVTQQKRTTCCTKLSPRLHANRKNGMLQQGARLPTPSSERLRRLKASENSAAYTPLQPGPLPPPPSTPSWLPRLAPHAAPEHLLIPARLSLSQTHPEHKGPSACAPCAQEGNGTSRRGCWRPPPGVPQTLARLARECWSPPRRKLLRRSTVKHSIPP